MLKESYTVKEVLELTGFRTPYMLDYLYRSGVVAPSISAAPGRGRRRRYKFSDVVLLRALGRLLKSGLPVRRLKKALEAHRTIIRKVEVDVAIRRYLITDGHEVFFRDDVNDLTNLNKDGQMEFAFVVDYEHARQEVIEEARRRGWVEAV